MRTFLNKILPTLMCIAFGVIVIVLAINSLKTGKTYTKTDAIITRIESEYNMSSESYDHTVYVKYSVNGDEYNEQLGYYQSGFTEGKEIEILYNPENPAQIMQASKGIYIAFLIVGPILILIGLSIPVKRRR